MKTDYIVGSIEHQLNDALVIRGKVVPTPPASSKIVRTLGTNIDTTLGLLLRTSEEVLHYGGNAKSRVKRIVKRKLVSHSKRPPTDGWRLYDKEFDQLHTLYRFTVEGCFGVFGLNGHMNLPFYSEHNSLLDHDVSHQSVYCKPAWSLSIQCVEHLRACHSRSPLDTRAVIVLPNWPKFKAVTKELKLIKQLPKGEKLFMRTTPTSTYDPPGLIPTV